MKKLIIVLSIFLISCASIYFMVYYKPTPKITYNPLDSRSRITDYSQIPAVSPAPLPSPDPKALDNLKTNLPYESTTFSVTWNEVTSQAEVITHQPYDQSTADFINWLAKISARDLPIETLKIIKQ